MNEEFVLWFHLDTGDFSLQMVGVAIANEKNNICNCKYNFINGFQPDNMASYDMGLYTDNNNKNESFLVRSVNNQYAGISMLNYNDTNTTGIISKGPQIEGVTIFKKNTNYYLLGSHLTGFSCFFLFFRKI